MAVAVAILEQTLRELIMLSLPGPVQPWRDACRGIARTLTIAAALVTSACSTLPDDTGKYPSYTRPAHAESTLVNNLKPLLAKHPGKSGFRPILQGEEAFLARLQLAAAARSSLDIQYYIWHLDLTGRVLYDALLKAADRGVRVRLLLDDLDTDGKDAFLRTLDHHPMIKVRLFNPFANRDLRLEDFVVDTRRVNRRMHNKTFTADGIASVFGGRNIGDEYFDATASVSFGDLDALAVGPVATEISAQFDLYWNSEHAYRLNAFDWEQPVSDATYAAFRAESADYFAAAADSRYAAILEEVESAKVERISDLDYIWSEWLLGFDQPRTVTMNKVSLETHLSARLLKAMELAEKDVLIVSPYFVPGKRFTAFLTGLRAKGVRVRILTNSLRANDVALVHAGYMRYRETLVKAGVELYEYRANSNTARRKLARDRIDVEKTSLHAKFFTIDNTYLFVGSFNLDGRSARLNTELGVYFRAPEQARALSDTFSDVMAQLAYEVVINTEGDMEWIDRSNAETVRFDHEPGTTWWQRFTTSVFSLFVPEAQL